MTDQERLAIMHCPGHSNMYMICEICAGQQLSLAVGEERSKIIEQLKSSGFEEAGKFLETTITISG